MKRFNISKHIYYLFKPNNNNGLLNSYEDVFVPKILLNLYNISKKPKKCNLHKKTNQAKFFLLNSNSYFPNNNLNQLNDCIFNNTFIAHKSFGNNKRYFSANKKNFQTSLPSLQKLNNNNHSNSITKNIKNVKYENKLNKRNKKAVSKLILTRKLNIANKMISSDIKSPIFEIEKNKEIKPKQFDNLSIENINNDTINRKLIDLESNKLKKQKELSTQKLNDINKNNFNDKTLSNSNKILKKYKTLSKDVNKNNKYNQKMIVRSIPHLKNLNNNKESFLFNNSYNYKRNIAPTFQKMVRLDSVRDIYKSEKEILDIIYNKKVEFPLINDNELCPTEKFYFCINKRYRNQLVKYMRHRINWEFYDSKAKYYDNININFEWKYYSHKVNFKNFKYKEKSVLKKLKVINLFEKNYEIGNKKNMFLNLISYCDKIGYNIFDIVPFTLIISNTKNLGNSFSALKELMEFISKENYLNNNIITNRKYNEHFWFDKNFQKINNQYINFNKNFISKKNYWILKPPDLYQGKCIEIENNYDEILKKCKKMFKGVDKTSIPEIDEEEYSDDDEDESLDEKYQTKRTKFYCCNDIIVQKYLDNPLLYQKRKFDIRCFVLLDSNLNVYFCREGHLKGCSEFYNLDDTNKFIHITNYSFQKNSLNFEKFEIGNEISYNDFKKFMKKEGIPLQKFEKMIEHMKFLIQLSLKSVSKKLTKINPVLCFEIFGYDFILDSDFRPWILEINDNPGLCISSPVIEKIIPRMLDDAFRLTIDVIFNTKYSPECFDSRKRYKSKFKLDGFRDDENIFEFLCNLN